MVGVGPEALARCTLVNFNGEVIFDKYSPARKIVDYRTKVSGIEPHHLQLDNEACVEFKKCQEDVAALIKDRVLIGHSLGNDLQALLLPHPKHMIRDTAHYKPLCPHRPKALKVLAQDTLGISIQENSHDSVEDARTVLAIYKTCKTEWEKSFAGKYRQRVMKAKAKQEAVQQRRDAKELAQEATPKKKHKKKKKKSKSSTATANSALDSEDAVEAGIVDSD